MQHRTSRLRRHGTAGLCLAAAALTAGCGSGHSSSSATPTRPAKTPPPKAKPGPVQAKGSSDLSATLAKLILLNNPLKRLKLTCAASSSFPKHCNLTGFQKLNGKSTPVTGKVVVLDVNPQTHTYDYTLTYQPAGRRSTSR